MFRVYEKDRNFLRFLWYKGNDFSKELVEYRMCIHVFGNSPPAVANYDLHRIAYNATEAYCNDVVDFISNDFYVDDGLTSVASNAEAIDLLKNIHNSLQEEGNLRDHNIASNSVDVLKSFPEGDLAHDFKHAQFDIENVSQQRSLVCLDLYEDF